MLYRTLLGVLLAAGALLAPRPAHADVDCGPDIIPEIALPITASFHLGSLLPVSIGLGTSKGRNEGWRNATYISSSINIANSVALLAMDSAELGGCGPDGLRGIHPATWVAESLFTAWSASLLIATALYDTTDASALPVSAYVVPVRDGAIAGVGFAF
jgi:hypothetical protein